MLGQTIWAGLGNANISHYPIPVKVGSIGAATTFSVGEKFYVRGQ